MSDGDEKPRGMPGREVLALAIKEYEGRVAFAQSAIEAYGETNCGARLRRSMELDNGVVVFLTNLMARGATPLSALATDKDGKPKFVDKLRWETTQEIVQLVAGSLRGAFQKFPPNAENAAEHPQDSAHAA
jgi:hypothetical protein